MEEVKIQYNNDVDENLNIHYHRIRLILKSLNCSKNIKDASKKCGLTNRTFYRYMKDNNIKYSDEKGSYVICRIFRFKDLVVTEELTELL